MRRILWWVGILDGHAQVVLFGQPHRSFYASELIRDAGTGSGAAQRELARLENSGLIVARRIGNQGHYQANTASPLFVELRSIVLKTVGLAEPLRDALKPLASDIRAAFIYGSVAKAAGQAGSDIDFMTSRSTLEGAILLLYSALEQPLAEEPFRRHIPRVRFEKVWIEQCRATKAIKRRFGAKSALDYLIGEKLITFADAARDHPTFAKELPRLLAAIWRLFNEFEIAGYVASRRPTARKRLRQLLYLR
jgi:hypothetical protein